MTGRSRRALGALSAAALVSTLVLGGCAGFTSDPALTLGLDNGTDRPVLIYVNDEWVGTFPVGAERDDITTSAHGGPPWRIEARTDGGSVVASFQTGGEGLPVGTMAVTECGNLSIWAGDEGPTITAPSASIAPCE